MRLEVGNRRCPPRLLIAFFTLLQGHGEHTTSTLKKVRNLVFDPSYQSIFISVCVLWWQTRALSAQIIFPVEIYFWIVIYQSRVIYKHKNNVGSYWEKKVNVMLELIIFLFYITCALWFCCSPHKSEKQANKRPKREKKNHVCVAPHMYSFIICIWLFLTIFDFV